MNELPRKLLIVDDDKGLREQLRWAFEDCEVFLAKDRKSALQEMGKNRPPVALLDLGLPPDPDGPTEGLSSLQEILSLSPETKVIVMTGQSDRAYAVEAVAQGAYDFYQKPVEIDVLRLIVDRAYGLYDLEEENRRISSAVAPVTIPGFITVNPELHKMLEKLRKFAQAEVSVLVLGESGTGKELLAKGIHALSPRAKNDFVAINCAAIPEQLLESELFGHEKGAFTGAIKTTIGKVELADGGTLFLDEIGDLSAALQAKLLRFLEERVIERVGGRRQIPVDLRIISATNKNLASAMANGEFREDLFFRLGESQFEIPPLRQRPDDILVIANHLVQEFATQHGRKINGLTTEALVAMSEYAWPGNVREMQNRIKGAVIGASGNKITREDLDLAPPSKEPAVETLKEARDRAERQSVLNALATAKGNLSEAARILKISRPTLYDLMRNHSLRP